MHDRCLICSSLIIFILFSSSLSTIISQTPFIYHKMLSNHSSSKSYLAKTLLPFLITMNSQYLAGYIAQARSSEIESNAKFQSSTVKESRKDCSLSNQIHHLQAYLHAFAVAMNYWRVVTFIFSYQFILTLIKNSITSWILDMQKYLHSLSAFSFLMLSTID